MGGKAVGNLLKVHWPRASLFKFKQLLAELEPDNIDNKKLRTIVEKARALKQLKLPKNAYEKT